MTFTGTLSVVSGESSLDGTLLAIEGVTNPLGEATEFLENKNLGNGDPAEITGEKGPLGTKTVIFMTDAKPLEEGVAGPVPVSEVAAPSDTKVATKEAGKKAARKAGKKSAKKAGKKKAAKKTGKKRSTKKTGKKRSTKKAGTKKSASKGTKKSAPRKTAKKSRRKK